jgi:hypothetical protein
VHSKEPGQGQQVAVRSGSASASRPQAEAMDWSWPPYAPLDAVAEPFDTDEWAPSSTVWHPQLRLGRWTVLYRRSA